VPPPPEPPFPHEDPRTATVLPPPTPIDPPVQPEPDPGPAPAVVLQPTEPSSLVDVVLEQAAAQVSTVVKPAAAAAVATTFGFPLALMAAVAFYLAAQWRVDLRDPKLRAAPQTTAETVVPFEEEERL
jgi:hypothetical protein